MPNEHELTTLLGNMPFLEGLRWRNGRLWVSDQFAGEVLAVDLDGSSELLAKVEMPSGIGWMPNGDMLVVSMNSQHLMKVGGGAATTAIDFTQHASWTINDMVIDQQGNAYVGQMGMMWGPEADPEGHVEEAKLLLARADGFVGYASDEPLNCANGMCVADDGRALLVAESLSDCITAFTIEDDGKLSDRRVFAKLDTMPDGLCLDAEGAVWISCPMAGRFVRVWEGGEVAQEIVLADERKAIACTLGGPDLQTLFLATNSTFHPDRVIAERGSRIEALSVDVPGVPNSGV